MMAAFSFVQPWLLLALAGLPVLWWLLRVTPPAPRRQQFPAIRLLFGLNAASETPSHTPLWLLALRLLAAALVIAVLAQPVLNAGRGLPGSGPLLLAIDDGWASASAWAERSAAAQSALDRAEQTGRNVALLTTADTEDGAAPSLSAIMPPADLRARLAALRPKPWPTDRAAAAIALAGITPGPVLYVADGLGDDPAFRAALAAVGPVEEKRTAAMPVLLTPPQSTADGLSIRLLSPASATLRQFAVRAQSGDGRTLGRVDLTIPAGADSAAASLALPTDIRNALTRLVLGGPPSAGSVALLDERWRRRPVGLLADANVNADAPLTGALYYLIRALQPTADLRQGSLAALASREVAVLIMADHVVASAVEQRQLADWVQQGGTLIRFAGPALAEQPDGLLPVALLGGDRQLGGAMSWTQPPGLAAFPANSPFAGLKLPTDIRINRQVLADPESLLQQAGARDDTVWARLEDGTPLVTQSPRGAGRIVLFHVTANADWSDLPLSGLFVDMLRRLVAQAHGVAAATAEDDATLLPAIETLDGFGVAGPPPSTAQALPANAVASTHVSPHHPPGLYGPESARRTLNVGAGVQTLQAAPEISGADETSLEVATPSRPLAPALMAVALALLAIDLLISLRLRGLWRLAACLALCLASLTPAMAEQSNPALATRLAYCVTGNAEIDQISQQGLVGLSDYVNRRTNAALATPAAVRPGIDDLSFYPLLYWPITPDAAELSGPAIQALNDYMSNGGIILIDTADGGSGEGMAPGAQDALRRLGKGLSVPPLAPLTPAHVLAKSFYLLQDFPGRYDGATIWVQRDEDRSNDSVSPVIIGGHGWAQAWAVDAQGRNPYATLPGGDRQRLLAYRFGVNLVMYALTGNYKGDQVHIPALLERLGQ